MYDLDAEQDRVYRDSKVGQAEKVMNKVEYGYYHWVLTSDFQVLKVSMSLPAHTAAESPSAPCIQPACETLQPQLPT